ncbi:MAG: hypothetical protein D6737_02840 [Chloroflexi bacterium]|nr:MAG: hypothetical protein D6737_02840 [Chloroflexota bacterium]
MLLSISAVSAQESPPGSLLALLATVPDTPQTREGTPILGYADYRAAEQASGLTNPGSLDGFLALSQEEQVQWVNTIFRLRAGPRLDFLSNYIASMPDFVGFEWFDVDRAVTYGELTRLATIFAGDFDATAMASVYAGRGFEQREISGMTVWHRFEDGFVDPAARAPGDPFGGDLGRSARVVALPGYVANGQFWDITIAAIDTQRGAMPSLADDANFRALAEAAMDTGLLVQAVYLSPDDVGDQSVVGLDGQSVVPEAVASLGTLPAYTLALLADRQEGSDQVHLVAAVYDDAQRAEIAAAELSTRLTTFDPLAQYAELGVVVDAPRIFTNDAGDKFVAVAAIRYPLSDEPAAQNGLRTPPGTMFATWIQAFQQRAFRPLAITA